VGVFSTSQYIEPGNFAIGIEPVVSLAERSGAAVDLRYTHGLSDLLNASVIGGVGQAPRRFRLGGNLAADLFPDAEGQPGFGVAGQALYYGTPEGALGEFLAIPYLHKTFSSGSSEFSPFVALPIGWTASPEGMLGTSTLSVGSLFRVGDNFHYVIELGINVYRSMTYVSGGLVYVHQ
jgi:hypothetical protein